MILFSRYIGQVTPTTIDPGLFFAEHNNYRVYLLIYAADCLIASSHLEGALGAEKSHHQRLCSLVQSVPETCENN